MKIWKQCPKIHLSYTLEKFVEHRVFTLLMVDQDFCFHWKNLSCDITKLLFGIHVFNAFKIVPTN